jgi:hypothetical protein
MLSVEKTGRSDGNHLVMYMPYWLAANLLTAAYLEERIQTLVNTLGAGASPEIALVCTEMCAR